MYRDKDIVEKIVDVTLALLIMVGTTFLFYHGCKEVIDNDCEEKCKDCDSEYDFCDSYWKEFKRCNYAEDK